MQKQKLAEAIAKQFSGLKVNSDDVKAVILKSGLNSEKPASWTEDNLFSFAQLLRKMTKPMIIAANKIYTPNTKTNL